MRYIFLLVYIKTLLYIFIKFSFFIEESSFVNSEGQVMGFWDSGTMVFGMCVVITNLKIFIVSNTFNFLNCFVIAASLLIYLGTIAIFNFFATSHIHYLFNKFVFFA